MKAKLFLVIIFCLIYTFVWSADLLVAQNPPEKRATRENIVTLMLLRMTQVLDLTEEQTARLFPLVNRVQKEKLRLTREAGKYLRELRAVLQDEEYDPKQLERIIDEIKDLRNQIKDREIVVEQWVEENLTLEQQAKFLIFFQDFNRYLQQKIQEARAKQPPQRKLPADKKY